MSASDIELESYRAGSELEIIDLFAVVFGGRKTIKHWRWQFQSNPHGASLLSLARGQGGRLIGQCAVMAVDLNVVGERVPAGQELDTMVHPEFRNLGIFEKSAMHSFEQMKAAGRNLVYGFPNQNALPGWLRKLGWSRVAFATRYTKRLSIYPSLTRALPWLGVAALSDFIFRRIIAIEIAWRIFLLKRNLAEVEFSTSDRVPEAYEELWQAVRSYEVISVWKDRRYLQWRYDEKPDSGYRYFFLSRKRRIDALAVVSIVDGNARIAELIVRDRSTALGQYLIWQSVSWLLNNVAHAVSCSVINQGFFEEVFRDGFKKNISNHVLCMKVLGNDRLAKMAEFSSNWTITEGDSDSI